LQNIPSNADVSKGKERKTHPSCDVDASGDANDGHNNLNYYRPQFLHSLSTHFPLLLFLQNTQQHPHLDRDWQIGPCGLTSIVNFKALS